MAPPLRLRPALALAVLTGLLFVPGFPKLSWWPCTLVAFAPLFCAIDGQTPRRALLLGWVAGLVSNLIVFSWLVATIVDFGELPWGVALGLLALLSAVHGLRLGLATWLSARAERRGWPAAPVFVGAFLTSELVFPLIFPWYVATAADHATALMQPAELGGPLLVDLILLAPSVAFGEAARAWRIGRRPTWSVVAVGLVLPGVAAAWGALRMVQVREGWESAPAGRIGLVQPNAANGAGTPVESLRASTLALAAQGAELVVWPETALHTAYNDFTYPKTIPAQVTSGLGVPTMFGVRMWQVGPTGGTSRIRHNSVLLADGADAVLGRYDKHQLLAFGEYTPYGELVPALAAMLSHTGHFTAGVGPQPLEWGDHRAAVMICYEDILASYVNDSVAAMDPDLLVNVTNDAWFGDTSEPWIHLGEARLRAIEHRRFLVRATNSGPSGVVDAVGGLSELGGLFVAEDRVVTVRYLHARTLYELLGDKPWWVVAGFAALCAFVPRPGRKHVGKS